MSNIDSYKVDGAKIIRKGTSFEPEDFETMPELSSLSQDAKDLFLLDMEEWCKKYHENESAYDEFKNETVFSVFEKFL